MTQRDKWQQRAPVVRYRQFGDELRLKLPGYKVPAELYIQFELPMPKSWSKKKRASMLAQPHQQKPDIDNLLKAFLDHLCEDDSYVWKVFGTKVWGEHGSITLLSKNVREGKEK